MDPSATPKRKRIDAIENQLLLLSGDLEGALSEQVDGDYHEIRRVLLDAAERITDLVSKHPHNIGRLIAFHASLRHAQAEVLESLALGDVEKKQQRK